MTAFRPHEILRSSEEKARKWKNSLNPDEFDDLESVVSSLVESSIVDSGDSESGEEQEFDLKKPKENIHNTDRPNYTPQPNLDFIQNQLHQLTTIATYSNISISNSTNVVLGNIIKINDDLTINVINNKYETKEKKLTNNQPTEVTENKTEFKIHKPAFHVEPRKTWLIREPNEKFDYLEEPVNLVVISHTATTISTDRDGNIEILRDIQTFHIDTFGWNDIAYNFLIGCDGNIYEGRGWGVEGAHCFGYNNRSIGISFVGCFINKLPTEQALKACKDLLIRGVDEGHLSRDYKLLGHRQCSTTESPGSKLFEEIQTWKHFYNKSIDDDLRVNKIEK